MYSCNLGLKRFTVCDVCARMCDRSQVALFLAGGDFEASLQVDADNNYLGCQFPIQGVSLLQQFAATGHDIGKIWSCCGHVCSLKI